MTDNFNRLASHFSKYWNDKGIEAPKMNFNIKAIEKEAEEKLKLEEDVENKPTEDKSKSSSKSKDFSVAGILADDSDMVERAIENKIKTLINRIADDKIRTAMSDDFALFEKSMATKIQDIVNRLKPKVLAELKTIAPDVGSKTKKDPANFTDVVMDEEDIDVFDKKSSVEVFPGIFVKANEQNTGNVFIKEGSNLVEMNYVIDLPKTNSKKAYIEELKKSIENIVG